MKSHRGFHSAAERRAVNRGDHRLRAIFNRLDHFQKVEVSFALARSDLAEFLDVSAGDERPAAADQNPAFDRIVVSDLLDGRRNAFRHAGAERVDRRVVDGDDADFAIAG